MNNRKYSCTLSMPHSTCLLHPQLTCERGDLAYISATFGSITSTLIEPMPSSRSRDPTVAFNSSTTLRVSLKHDQTQNKDRYSSDRETQTHRHAHKRQHMYIQYITPSLAPHLHKICNTPSPVPHIYTKYVCNTPSLVPHLPKYVSHLPLAPTTIMSGFLF